MKGDQNKRSKRVKNITRENLYKIKIKEIIYKSKKNSLSTYYKNHGMEQCIFVGFCLLKPIGG